MVGKRGQRQRRGQELGEKVKLLLQYSLAKWASFLEELSSENSLEMEDFYSTFTFEALKNFHSEVSRL